MNTLYFASLEGMDRDDLRTLSVLTMWLSVYSRWINDDRLVRVLQSQECSERVRCFWTAFSRWMEKDRRFSRFAMTVALFGGLRGNCAAALSKATPSSPRSPI